MQREFLRELAANRYGEQGSGYFFVLNRAAEPLMVGAFAKPYNHDLSPLSLSAGQHKIARQLFDAVLNGEGMYTYEYINPRNGKNDEKTSFLKFFEPWDWAIGTGFYHSDFEQMFELEKNALQREARQNIRTGLLILLFNLLFSLALAFYTNRHIKLLERSRRQHLQELEQYKKLLDLSCLVSKSDLHGHITYANDTMIEVSGYSWAEMAGKPHNIFRHPSVPKSVFKGLWDTIQAGEVWRGTGKNRRKDGTAYITKIVIMPLFDEQGRIVEYIAARHDVTELFESREKLQLAFATDSLTSLGSRYKLIQDIENSAASKCLVLLDINGFRDLNREIGSGESDLVLQWVADKLLETFTSRHYRHYRLQADTFAVFSETVDCRASQELVHEFLAFFTQQPCPDLSRPDIRISLSSGMAEGEQNLLSCADIALKKAKRDKTALVAYVPSLDAEQLNRSYWLSQVLQALQQNRLTAYYQPIVDLRTGNVVKYEALMRLLDADGKPVPPGEFLPIMKQTHHYAFMTQVVIETACAVFQNRREGVSVNLSVDDLLRPETVKTLLEKVQRQNLAGRLTMEVVETENIHNYDEAMQAMKQLRNEGIQVAIDDFGTGYANFTYLTEMQADVIKLDGSLVKQVNTSTSIRELLLSLVTFAHQSGMQVVAEYVSSAEILSAMQELGVDFGQGYLFSPPLAGEDLPDEVIYEVS